jgi:hypothetical protein
VLQRPDPNIGGGQFRKDRRPPPNGGLEGAARRKPGYEADDQIIGYGEGF